RDNPAARLAAIEECLGWVAPVMELRAVHDGVDPEKVRWRKDKDARLGWSGVSLLYALGRYKGVANRMQSAAEHWLGGTYGSVAVHREMKRGKRGESDRLVCLPLLTGAEQCMAYAIFLMRDARYDFSARVRACEYLNPSPTIKSSLPPLRREPVWGEI